MAAATYGSSDTDFSGRLGTQHIDGAAVSVCGTVREGKCYAHALYSVGLFSDATDFNALLGIGSSLGGVARGTAGA